MRRREVIAMLGSTVAWPFSGHAAGNHPRIAVLEIKSAASEARNLAAFRDSLQRLGYIEGRTVDVDYRHADGETNSLQVLAQELVQSKPDVVLTDAVSPTRAVKQIAPAVPIVCVAFGETFIPSLAASFARPGGSVTGIASDVEGLFGKLIELTLDAISGTTNIGFLANPAGASMAYFEQQVRSAAKVHGVEVRIEEVGQPDDFDGAFQRLNEQKVQAVIVPPNGLLTSARQRIVDLSRHFRLPLIFQERDGVEAGGLASYGINLSENYSRAAIYIDKILKGAAPGDLPIEFPTKLELVINLKTARALGVTVPPTLLNRADEVIE